MSRAAKPRRLAEAAIDLAATPALSISSAIAALAADQESKPRCADSPGCRLQPTKGVHALDAMDQPVLDQEVERAIDRRRRRAQLLVA